MSFIDRFHEDEGAMVRAEEARQADARKATEAFMPAWTALDSSLDALRASVETGRSEIMAHTPMTTGGHENIEWQSPTVDHMSDATGLLALRLHGSHTTEVIQRSGQAYERRTIRLEVRKLDGVYQTLGRITRSEGGFVERGVYVREAQGGEKKVEPGSHDAVRLYGLIQDVCDEI